jgi:TolB-like protein/tetratricopeptide (TPR) repeat protein
MTASERWRDVQRVVDGALDLPTGERAPYLDRACNGDAALREEAVRLLQACERAAQSGGLFARPAASFLIGAQPPALDRYTIERELGHGGMATVYLARDLRHDRDVAVKVLHPHVAPAGSERFLREIHIAARLTHPHVLGLFDSGQSEGQLYYVMPYVAGETLRSRLARDGALPIADAVRVARELADALAYAHAHGVVNRDLKPENVLLSGGHAVVADFGIAKALAAATEASGLSDATLTGTGVIIGTPAYMAPEQVAGDSTLDHRADLYSLGVIAYEMLTGSHPFAGRTGQAVARAHITETPPPLGKRRGDVPAGVASLVMQLLAKDPAARPENATSVLRSLESLAAVPARPWRYHRAALGGVTIAVLAAVAFGVYYVAPKDMYTLAARPQTALTIAVLPFANTSGSPDDDYFSEGLTDELAHALAHVPGVRVAGRSSSYAFKGKSVSAAEIGKSLGVVSVIEGAVRRSGERLRVTTQLVRTSDGTVLWDSAYQSQSRDVFAVQDSLTRAVVASLAPALGLPEVRGDTGVRAVLADVKRGTPDGEAYELYLKGMYYWHERGATNVARSIELFQQAIARDPKFARAYAALAFAYETLGVYVPDPSDSTFALIKANARRAFALDSTLADAQLAVAGPLSREGRFAESEARYRAAIRSEPSNVFAHHTFGAVLLDLGRTDEAIAELRLATRLDPLAKSAGTMFAEALIDARRFRESIDESHRILAIDDSFPVALISLGLAQAFAGQPDSAVLTLERGLRLYPDQVMLRGRLLFAYAAAGRWNDVERMRARLRQPGVDRTGGALPAFADLVLGDREPLIRLVTAPGGLRLWFDMLRPTEPGAGCNPLADPLSADGRYRAAIEAAGLKPCALARPWPLPPRPTKPGAERRY